MYQPHQPISCYVCPLCATSLQLIQKSYVCENNHHFDLAKEGYLNLLPVQHKRSVEPGDNKQMMQARREFLEAGYYEPMAKAVAMMVNINQPKHLLDLGCGEGYYSRMIEAYCPNTMMLHGVDIAKFAIAAAAKKQPNARFIVASSNRLPYTDQYFDFVLRVFAPSNEHELGRILKPSGFLLTVTPGPRHLWQLKEFIYTDAKEHALENGVAQGFDRIDTQHISYKIAPNPQQRIALLQMTPFAWRANESVQQAIKDVAELEIETDFILTLAIKTAD
ncbi:23S rRNA (guanine(745)-N(1))-methyltransferase [Methylobacter tundripaludum]|uniref:rRNA (Guanine-N(1)-)-methyltransferase n=1 Tax=Methylobacter tundripaludum (strain ATCC BAA-1195 / DSM 17260 / SV96) TaxID=697282 RepID=G3IW65_METTV|nr:23S rRNA (guanine(745)-N(1))-methyltransferase [Methylobacter tundripaludum]EGW21876.1 rRNA (guanine-N(1)-)-methyltransferase [Methylobacter tundripaludum SV96]